jgi:hypothetical protein
MMMMMMMMMTMSSYISRPLSPRKYLADYRVSRCSIWEVNTVSYRVLERIFVMVCLKLYLTPGEQIIDK